MLQFDILEERNEDLLKLMVLCSSKYHAKRWGDTTMLIMDEDGGALVEEYLTGL